jgi:hypothetical protein
MTNVDRIPGSVEWGNLQDAQAGSTPSCNNDARFIADDHSKSLTTELATLCSTCPILAECRAYATRVGPYRLAGFWAGRWRGDPRNVDLWRQDA